VQKKRGFLFFMLKIVGEKAEISSTAAFGCNFIPLSFYFDLQAMLFYTFFFEVNLQN